ncbi:MAG: PEP/pyruvate-binding domain-containing protein, partial [Acidimicrobiales bacterium]
MTTAATSAWSPAPGAPLAAELRAAWDDLTGGGARSLVVRSSSTIEDGESTSLAGMFTSVLDVQGWDAFLGAVDTVLSSMKAVPGIEMAPMGVLVQPLLAARVGGVLFGADPVSGRTDRLVVAAAEGAPEQLVSGAVDGSQYLLSARGRKLGAERAVAGLGRSELRALARLARRVATVFGGPQDVEWAFEGSSLRLLQSRPITAVAADGRGEGPLLGPGPVAETYPGPLAPLEEDLWVAPLRTALSEAVLLTGAASRRQVDASPVVTTVGGRVAADLVFLGAAPARKGFLARFDPRPPARRLVASWRVGRLGAALPGLVGDLIDEVDDQLLDVPPLVQLSDERLAGLLRRSRQALVALNGYEVLSGLLVHGAVATTTGASLALQVLAEGRAQGRTDADIATAHPVVLALVPPRIGPGAPLPPAAGLPVTMTGAGGHGASVGDGDEAALLREALRLRVRWVQELTARAAWELGRRLAAAGILAEATAVRDLHLDELDGALRGQVPADLAERRNRPAVAPLPAAFRLSASGHVVAERPAAGAAGG